MSHMVSEFEMSNMGLIRYFLGIEVYQVQNENFIFQKKVVKDIMSKFSMLNCNPTTTPTNINEKITT